ncbi:unnamed protein product, partial [Rhizoctonia solani]
QDDDSPGPTSHPDAPGGQEAPLAEPADGHNEQYEQPITSSSGKANSPTDETVTYNHHTTEPSSDETIVPEITTNPVQNIAAIQSEIHPAQDAEGTKKSKHPKNLEDQDPVDSAGIQTKFTASRSSALWDKYVKLTEAEDKDIIEDWEGAIDVTLVFAALFSAISTGFVLESSKEMKPDQAAITVSAIRELTSVVQIGFQLPVGNIPSSESLATSVTPFKPSKVAVWVNCLWFFSLGLSISVSLFAMLAKRWCYKCRSRHSGTPYERAVRRQEAWDALQKWKLELLIEQLPTVMHVALNQRYAFRALMWLLQHSNDSRLIKDVVDYVISFPEVILDSLSSNQELHDATILVAEHFQRLKHDAIEHHTLAATFFGAKCGRLMYLNARPWLHFSDPSANKEKIQLVYNLRALHSPDMSTEELKKEIQAIKEQKFTDNSCILWLERQAIKMVLGCPPETGFVMCRELYQSAISNAGPINPELAEEICSTLSWMFLNTVIDASNSSLRAFWPSRNGSGRDGDEPRPVARCDSTLALSYFLHSEARKNSCEWLKVVGVAGMLDIPAYYPDDEVEPDMPPNIIYYKSLIQLLRNALLQIESPGCDPDPYIGKLPVYYESEIRLYEFDSLKYCYDALDRASRYWRFDDAQRSALNEVKNMIPERRRLKWDIDPVGRSEVNEHTSIIMDNDEEPDKEELNHDPGATTIYTGTL